MASVAGSTEIHPITVVCRQTAEEIQMVASSSSRVQSVTFWTRNMLYLVGGFLARKRVAFGKLAMSLAENILYLMKVTIYIYKDL